MRRHITGFWSLSLGTLLATASLLAAPPVQARDWNLFPGYYARQFISVVPIDAKFLIHPTGVYKDPPKKASKAGYEPTIDVTDDMDGRILELRAQGYVMVGYSAVNTRVLTNEKFQCDENQLTDPGALGGCRSGMWLAGYNWRDSPLGNIRDAGVWANAAIVVMQKNYSFSRRELQQRRLASETRNTNETAGGSDGAFNSDTSGNSNTVGRSTTVDGFKEGNWNTNVGGTVGASKQGGPSGSIGGGYGAGGSSGTSVSNTDAASNTSFNSATTGASSARYGETQRSRGQHWATQLAEAEVDHYDYMVTYWKKADTRKMAFGALTDPAPRNLWSALGTRQARIVTAVTGGTPAFDADLWEGDVIVKIDGQAASSSSDAWGSQLVAGLGREVKVTIWREGQFYELPIKFNPPSAGSNTP